MSHPNTESPLLHVDHCEHGPDCFAGHGSYCGSKTDVYFYKEHGVWHCCERHGSEPGDYGSGPLRVGTVGFSSIKADVIAKYHNDRMTRLRLFLKFAEGMKFTEHNEIIAKG